MDLPLTTSGRKRAQAMPGAGKAARPWRGVFATAGVCLALWAAASRADAQRVPILVYHRFAPTVVDGMTVRTATFESHLRILRTQGYAVIPLRDLLDYLDGTRASLPRKAVVLTADDGHRSVYEVMYPLIVRERLPVTLFIYPSAISNARYALTWAQLRTMRQGGLVDVESHSYWHPNFLKEKRRLAPEAYRRLVARQLSLPRQVIGRQLGGRVDLLAWPFGLYDAALMRAASDAGYRAAFTLDARAATRHDARLALPRFLMVDRYDATAFAALLRRQTEGGAP